jgi:hypothetical protein
MYRKKKTAAVQHTLDSFFRKPKNPGTTVLVFSAMLSPFQNLPQPQLSNMNFTKCLRSSILIKH